VKVEEDNGEQLDGQGSTTRETRRD
jgi:hypothetical protein